MRTRLVLLTAFLSLPLVGRADDWPQWQGRDRNSISKEKGLLKTWPKAGPRLGWTQKELGVGYSSAAVVGDRIYILGTQGDSSYLFALDATSGKEVWKVKVGPIFDFKGNQWGKGPRATPTVADGLVYALGGFGDLVCVR